VAKRLDPAVAAARMREAGAEPLEPYPGADAPWRCQCLTCGTVGHPRLSSIDRQGTCRPCGRLRANASTRLRALSKAQLDPDGAVQLMRDAGLEPLTEYPGANTPWACCCHRCGHEVSPSFASVRSGRGCRHCASADRGRAQRGRSVAERGNADYDADRVVQVMRDAGMEPLVEYPGRNAPWPSRCLVCRTVGSPRLTGIQGGQGGCVPCGQAKVAAASRARRVDEAAAAAEMTGAGLTPLVPYPGAVRRWKCRCDGCGREVAPTLMSVRRGSGCRYCATHGLDLTAPALLYVISHPVWGAHKVGIGACVGYNSRLTQHERAGWELAESRVFPTGWAARDVEQAVLDRLRAAQLAPYLDAATMPNGWTETCDAARVTAAELCAMVEAETDRAAATAVTDTGPRRRPSAAGLVDPQVAVQEMRAVGLEPLGPYPGWTNVVWPCRCTTCGRACRPRLNDVRQRGSSCRTCRAQAAGAARSAAKADEALGVMRAAGFEPLTGYPGSQQRWPCRCTGCGEQSTPMHSNVRRGSRCRHCHHPGWRRRGASVPAAARSRSR
jgi:hypothetical protein